MTQIRPNQDQPVQRRPDVGMAMRGLIQEMRAVLPFGSIQVCTGDCQGCSRKLLEFLDLELTSWEQRLAAGERPGLNELSRLLRTARRIEQVLIKNGLLPVRQRSSRP